MDLNLDTLKREILEYLEASGFAVFFSSPGGLEGLPMVLWDSEGHPDYQAFLEVGRKSGAKLVLFATREFESADIDDLMEHLEECEVTREERRDYETRLRGMHAYEGTTCSLEIAFDYHSRLYVYELRPDWYEDFLEIEDELASRAADEDEELGGDDSLGGYFSKN